MERPHHINPITKLWENLGCNALLNKLLEFMKFAQIVVTAILGFGKNERTLSTYSFVKNKVKKQSHTLTIQLPKHNIKFEKTT